MRGLSKYLSDVTVASSQYDLLLCSETWVSDKRHISELMVPGFGRPVLLCRDGMRQARGMAAYVRDGYGAFCQPKFECGCCEILDMCEMDMEHFANPNLSVAVVRYWFQGVWC